MSTDDFIMALFLRVDTVMADVPKDPRAHLYPSEIVTLALLFAQKGVGPQAFYRWLSRNYLSWFPGLPERTRLFRLFAAHADWAEVFLAQPTILGVIDSYGIELRHLWREDRAGRPPNRWQRLVESSLDCRSQIDLPDQSIWTDCGLGLRHRQRLRASMPKPVIRRICNCADGLRRTSAWWSKRYCRC